MTGPDRIWRLDGDGAPTALRETPYDDEADLQALIARHPDVLAGEQMTPGSPRRWLLIRREMGIADGADSGARWAVDHLLLDQDARPTLVEVKRGDNPEIRRRVVGQMLDYAAHATRYWSADGIRARFEEEAGGEDAARERLAERLSIGSEPDGNEDRDAADAYAAFWERVGTNLRADNVRLLFVADHIPDDLAHVVRFLHRNMQHVEVLAVELKQFRIEGEGARTIVPRVIGRPDGPRPRGGGAGRRHTQETLLAEFPDNASREAARQLLERSRAAGAALEFGPRGVSVRGRCGLWGQPVTVAWLFPPDAGGWMRTRDFSFGAAILENDPPPAPEMGDALRRYAQQFEDDRWARDASSKGVSARYVLPEDAVAHIGKLAGRVEAVLRELASL